MPNHGKHSCHCEHMDNKFENILDLLQEVKREMLKRMDRLEATEKESMRKLRKMEDRMAQGMQELQEAVEKVSTSVDGLKGSVEQLIAKLDEGGQDTTPIVEALGTLDESLTALKESIDSKLNPETPPEPA